MPKKQPTSTVPPALAARLREEITRSEYATIEAALAAMAVGFVARHVKLLLPHGEFGPWLKREIFPKLGDAEFSAKWRRVQRWQLLTVAVEERLKNDTVSQFKVPKVIWEEPEIEMVQAAYRALTRDPETELTEAWEGWLAAVNVLLHENTQQDLILELRRGTDEPWQQHTPPKALSPDEAMQLELELVCSTVDGIRNQLVMLKDKLAWDRLPKDRRISLVEASVPVFKALAAHGDWTKSERKLILDLFVGVTGEWRERL